MTDTSTFPDPTYRDTVLAPLFEGVKIHFADHMDRINRAHLVMLVETGIVLREDGEAIAEALADIETNVDRQALDYTGEHEDWFFLVEAELRARLGDLGGALHTARSRNDMDHTMFKMALRDRAENALARMLTLAQALLDKARAERDTLIVAYTHGQPAQPATFGHYLSAVIEVLVSDARRLETAITHVDHCPMGAAAITTSGFPIDRERMAELLGFAGVRVNAYGCIAGVDYVTGLYSALKLPMIHLGRVVQDMAFWSAFEVGQLYVPRALVQISSIMPQKRNPVPIEHLRHLASVAAGRCDAMINTMHNTPFTDMNDSEGEVQQAGYGAFDHATRVFDLLTAFLPACSINADRVAQTTDAACITITELADTLVRDEGLSFRLAHDIASQTARAVIADARPLGGGYAAFSQAFEAATGKPPKLNAAEFAEAVDARTFVSRRDRTGGPAPAALDAAFEIYSSDINALKGDLKARLTRRDAAAGALDTAFDALLKGPR
ncbi:argininosuccinate lyase [Jannaschia sp. CCS1]|uniref:argininosuccinate lyase n=1 Tax=Jannaschia sp. (strain CCS1) TaxID=290400 RepID=UPI00006C0059|nr:argininosuccinate lyase [Jannaschia sp. CCS1]ABD55501.1 argininosuccinate lyase [Jannaschia sp. CCS1]